jgi:polysaccharide export outer membrane protein
MKKVSIIFIFFILSTGYVFSKDYVIGDGDNLQISVWGSPELSLGVTVRPDGKISLPALGEVKASGLTPTELKDVLEKELASIVKKPIVTVIVTGMRNYDVLVFGNGAPPGIRTLNKETTLLQFLSQLGSVENADFEKAYLVRNNQKIKTGFYELFIKGDLEQDIVLEPNDILFIPDNFDGRINVVGAVKNPTIVPYREGLTILDVILSAGGFTDFAKKNDVLVIRNKDGQELRRVVRVKDLTKGELSENIKMMPGDFVIVKESFF